MLLHRIPNNYRHSALEGTECKAPFLNSESPLQRVEYGNTVPPILETTTSLRRLVGMNVCFVWCEEVHVTSEILDSRTHSPGLITRKTSGKK